jgi:hypothetical protein
MIGFYQDNGKDKLLPSTSQNLKERMNSTYPSKNSFSSGCSFFLEIPRFF